MTIVETVESWPGVEVLPHRFGGQEFRFGRTEFGHVHGETMVDIPFPRPVRDALVAAGEAETHHVLPDSGWVSFYVTGPADGDDAIRLLRLAYLLRVAGVQRRDDADPTLSAVDAAGELDAVAFSDGVRAAVAARLDR